MMKLGQIPIGTNRYWLKTNIVSTRLAALMMREGGEVNEATSPLQAGQSYKVEEIMNFNVSLASENVMCFRFFV